ncbi:hypothetical protein HOC01_02565 [archaeon]|nr:hypothetical protein [archaeon]MBT6697798.1 hypothetical protein [archaeon]
MVNLRNFLAGRKAQSNMFWIIIGAVIALVVMVVLILMFTSKSNVLEIGLLDCGSKGGSCEYEDSNDCKTRGGGTWSSAFECEGTSGCCFEKSTADS